ncbi:Guanine exchange factor for Rac 30 [Pelomyxa schiedti]|nr:Guanine exchange factor for Rac 30 [Pelomyxa schiedti]
MQQSQNLLQHLLSCAFLKVYTLWVSTYERACTVIGGLSQTPEFASWLQKQKQIAGMDIFSFLILPVQRIPRYVMLLEQIVKYADKTQPDYRQLTESHAQMKSVALHINEKKRDAEAMLKVKDIEDVIVGKFVDPIMPDKPLVQPQRRFIHEGAVMLKSEKGLVPRYLFLFNDIIVETHTAKKTFFNKTGQEVYKYVNSASLLNSSVTEDTDTTFQLATDSKVFSITCNTADQKAKWLTKLKEASCWLHQVNVATNKS